MTTATTSMMNFLRCFRIPHQHRRSFSLANAQNIVKLTWLLHSIHCNSKMHIDTIFETAQQQRQRRRQSRHRGQAHKHLVRVTVQWIFFRMIWFCCSFLVCSIVFFFFSCCNCFAKSHTVFCGIFFHSNSYALNCNRATPNNLCTPWEFRLSCMKQFFRLFFFSFVFSAR